MPPTASLMGFAVASVMILAVPGPGVLFVIGRSLTLGRSGGLLTVVGNELGAMLLVVAVALGVGSIVAESRTVFTAVKLVGAVYLVYLGVQALRHRHLVPATPGDPGGSPTGQWHIVRQGLVVGMTNPKDAVFFVAVLPQFVDVHAGDVPAQMLVLGLVFTSIALICDGAWVLLADAGSVWLSSSPRRLATIRGCGGVLIVGLGVALAFAGNGA